MFEWTHKHFKYRDRESSLDHRIIWTNTPIIHLEFGFGSSSTGLFIILGDIWFTILKNHQNLVLSLSIWKPQKQNRQKARTITPASTRTHIFTLFRWLQNYTSVPHSTFRISPDCVLHDLQDYHSLWRFLIYRLQFF